MAPQFGSRLLPMVVDETAKERPDLPYAYVPIATDVKEGFKAVTFHDIATATNHLAAWIHKTLGPSSSFDTLAYMGIGDLRYVVVFLAAVKCGYKVLLPSPRNSPWMNASLLEQTQCRHFLYGAEVEPLVKPLLEHRADLQLHPVDALAELVQQASDTAAAHYPYRKAYDAVRWDPILVLHSSGSTGAPKPIVMNHATFAVGDNDRTLPTVPGRVNQNWSLWDFPTEETFFSPFPAFHLAGFSSMVLLPIYYQNAKLVMSPPSRPPTGHLVSEIMDHFKLKSIFCPPIIAEQLVQEPGGMEKCKNLKFLLYAGGPLSRGAGEALSKVTDVCQFYGQTETGAIQALVPLRENWASLEWNPIQEVKMELFADDVYEMTMHRNTALEKVRSLSANFPDVDVWHTKDLFKRHPTNPALWTFHGRVDDIVVLSNGEKFNPVPSEVHISAHPLVHGALIIGQGHPQPLLLLEPADASQPLAALLEAVWPTVEEANAQAPGQGRITKDMILLGDPAKPFVRSPKGTVVRTTTGEQYQEEISALYTDGVSRGLQHTTLDAPADRTAVTEFVTQVLKSVFPGHQAHVQPGDDLFTHGLDSLQTLELVKLLRVGIRAGNPEADTSWINVKFVYEHPSVTALAHAIHLVNEQGTDSVATTNGTSSEHHRIQKMEDMVHKYTKDLAPGPGPRPRPRTELAKPPSRSQARSHEVILTGSTGSLGTQLLVKLLADPNVTHITCLDRGPNAKERIEKALAPWTKPPVLDTARVSFHRADYSQPDLGLAPAVLAHLGATVDVIIHNAWKVDFNHSLETFEAVHVQGVRNLVDFSATSPLRPRIVFISSISSVGGRTNNNTTTTTGSSGPVVQKKEEVLVPLPQGLGAAQRMGYAESKAVAEYVLDAAARTSGLDVAILRVGQIAGPIAPGNGATWNATEWFPLLLKTAKTTGLLPSGGRALERVDWVPVDVLAATVWDVATRAAVDDDDDDNEDAPTASSSPRVLHLVNPTARPWTEIVPVLEAGLGGGSAMKEVSMAEWIAEVEKTNLNDADDVASKPAVKILDFFKDLGSSTAVADEKGAVYSTVEARKSSDTFRGLGPVQDEWVTKWIKDLGFA